MQAMRQQDGGANGAGGMPPGPPRNVKMKGTDAAGIGVPHTSLSMRTDSYVNDWIIAQQTRQKSALGHVSVR